MAKTRSAKAPAKKKTTSRGKAAPAARGLSLHIGLNSVDPRHYAGWSGDLRACEFDAHDMAALAKAQKLKPTVLLTAKATRAGVLKALHAAASTLGAGDLFFLSYSGHGGQMPDVSGEEDDKLDETWCLFDGELIDDELFNELGRFESGVRIVVLSDSCHSGTVTRARPPQGAVVGASRSKMMPPSVAMRTYTMHQAFYDKLQRQIASDAKSAPIVDPDAALAQLHAGSTQRLTQLSGKMRAAVLLISGCQDNQTSLDGDHNGAFTEQLLRVWNEGRFRPRDGNYVNFHAAIKAGMPPTQTPNLFTLGRAGAFARQRPFTISR